MTRLQRIKVIHMLKTGSTVLSVVEKLRLEPEDVIEINTYTISKIVSEKDVADLETLGEDESVNIHDSEVTSNGN